MFPNSTKEPAFHFIFALSLTVLQPAKTTRADPGLLWADQVTSDSPKRKIRQHHLHFDFPLHTSYPGKLFPHKLNYITMNLKSVMHILQRGETSPFMKLQIRDLPFYFGIDKGALLPYFSTFPLCSKPQLFTDLQTAAAQSLAILMVHNCRHMQYMHTSKSSQKEVLLPVCLGKAQQ